MNNIAVFVDAGYLFAQGSTALTGSDYRKVNKGIPSEFDGRLIAKGRDAIGRDLNNNEKKNLRIAFFENVRKRKPDLFKG
jgi:hypothetical protein